MRSVFLIVVVTVLAVSTADAARTRGTNRRRQRQKTVDPDVYLEKFGYLGKVPQNVQHSPAARKQAIRNFQRMTGLNVTGRMDRATQRKMAAPRCGMPDMVPPGAHMPPPGVAMDPGNNPENFYIPGYKWSKMALKWKTVSYTPDLPRGSVRRAFYNAFKFWSDVTPLTFREVSSGEADIEIGFGRRDHGDGPANSFDGKGGTLAHAFYPEDGKTHFDEDEDWTEYTRDGTNLEIVAAHEFGHALGLGHSNIQAALMAPFYSGYDENFKLHQDDIWGLQTIYGGPTQPETTPRPTSRPRPTTPKPTSGSSDKDTCTTKFGAVMQAHDSRIYVFNSKWLWRLNDWGVDPGYPKRLTKEFVGAPYRPGAVVYSWRSRHTYFFKSKRVWKFYGFTKIQKKTVKSADYPSTVQSAIIGRDGLIYLLSGADYWVFDESTMDVKPGGRRPISSKWPGIPANIESAVRLRDGHLYFFKGTKYRKYDEYYKRVLPGYPKDKAGPWMGRECGGQYIPK